MINLVPIIQKTMDDAFAADGLYTYWQTKAETSGEVDEYIVFTLAGQQGEAWSDDIPYITRADATIRYFYRREKISNHRGRTSVMQRTADMWTALNGAGFDCPAGPFDAGDIDGNGYRCTIMEVNYRE